MGRALHFDCFSGAAGDMILGAMIDAGLPESLVRAAVEPMLPGVAIRAELVTRGGVRARRFQVTEADGVGSSAPLHRHRHLPAVLALVERAGVSAQVRHLASTMLRRLAEVEADVHGLPVERVHLHEVGAEDSIVDIVGTALGFEWFGAERITCSPVNVGSGTVETAHGVLPVPAPATARLIAGMPVYADGPSMELLTPTGALVLATFVQRFGPLPPMVVSVVGHGAGQADPPGRPNVVRLLVGDATDGAGELAADDTVVVLECEVDDVSPQVLGAFLERALAAGALDVYLTPVIMKKQRPGTLVTVLSAPGNWRDLCDLVFREIPTLGVRYHEARRQRLAREHVTVETGFGPARIKLGRRGTRIVTATPEFEDCARLAAAHGVPVRDVITSALVAWRTATAPPPAE